MRYIMALLILAFTVISCSTTQEVEAVKPEPAKELPPRQSADQPQRRPAFDIEKLLAHLALSEEKEAEFLNMWNSTRDKMRQTRIEYKDDRALMMEKLREVKAERDEGLRTILTQSQLTQYYEYMAQNRSARPKRFERNGGN